MVPAEGKKHRFLKVPEDFAIAAAAFSILQLPIGHMHTVQVAKTQPVKLAAFEALYKTTKGAPLCIIGVPNAAQQVISPPKIEIPNMLSYLIYGDFNAEVKGLDCVPEDERPPQLATFLTFRGMVGLGSYMLLLTLAGVFLLMKGTLYENRTFLTFALFSIPAPLIANELGWISAEVGRQPWIVQGMMKTRDAFSPVVPAGQVALSIFFSWFSPVFTVWIFLLGGVAHRPEALSGGPQEGKDNAYTSDYMVSADSGASKRLRNLTVLTWA
jgi:cytochrome d ubiquinol oxidase subunit I